MADYVSGNERRVFVNPTLGCDSNCSYCYLGSQGLSIGQKPPPPKSADFLFESLLQFSAFQPGRKGSVISIGCYSECWSGANVEVTKGFIERALPLGNPIQLATKRKVAADQLLKVSRVVEWPGQLSVFMSCSTISQWRIHEKGTARPVDRFSEISLIKDLGIKVCIYIKPVLKDVTMYDLDLFLDVVAKRNVPVVVGEMFFYDQHLGKGVVESAPIPSNNLYVKRDDEQREILEFFREKGYIALGSSIEMVNYWRE